LEGNASLQNSLEMVVENFAQTPEYARKEVLVIFSSLNNADPGDIFETIRTLKTCKIKVSVISLSASIFILNKIAQET